MKKSLARKITLSILASAVLMSSSVVWATPVTQAPDVGVSGWTEVTVGIDTIWHTSGEEIQFGTGISTNKNFASAFNSNGDATGGKVTISGGAFNNTYIFGGLANGGNGSANSNEVSISGENSSTFGQIAGGWANSSATSFDASDNKVVIDAKYATFTSNVYGGYINKGNANKNTVTINAGTFEDDIYGGNASNGSADDNTVNIKGGTFDDSMVMGGYATDANASNNTVSISGVEAGSDFGYVYGGQAFTYNTAGDASNNTVIINAEIGKFECIYGGESNYNGNANENTVIISNGTFEDSIYGGSTNNGSADGNTVEIKGGKFNHTVSDGVYGGNAVYGSASNNMVSISGVSGGFGVVYGGRVQGAGVASNNTVKINVGTFIDDIFGGNTNKGSADGNIVEINGGEFTGSDVYGGYANDGNASNNTVSIGKGVATSTFNRIFGGLVGGTSGGEASNNTVIIDAVNGTFNSHIYGGHGYNDNANNNTVTINGGTFNGGSIYGGYVSGTGKEAVNNTVNIGGNATLNNVVNIWGGTVNNAEPYYGGSASPNTLNLNGWQNSDKSVGLIAGFDVINFNDCKWEDGEIVVQTGNFSFDSDLKINVNEMSTEDVPNVGDEMTLIESDYAFNEGKSPEYSTSRATFMASGYERVIGEVYQTDDDKNIKLKVKDVSANEQILAIGESRVAASALTNQGSELIETGLDALARDNDKDTKVFAALYGNASEYETGSHVKVNGWNGIVGVGKTNANGVTMGAFFENGEGNYRTFNEYEGEFMRGDGEATYNGGGFLYRKDTASGVYTEASLRAGNLQNELRNAVIANDELAGYDIDTFYYGAHVGIGKVIPRGNEGDSIDVYGKFIYTHYDDEDFTVDGGKFHLDSIESERLRLGFRINEVQNNKLNMYYGAAWEYEFGGDSNNSVVGYDIDVNAPSLEGSTVIGEVGMHYKASDKWSIDLNLRGYSGQRDGFSGSVQANYSF